ncbi:MAG: hypothetical protein L0211_24660, partial [Planctomycetaceae bacterium]|nr:hypothetical protein [Planctomycetaceae bacterium]
MSPAGAAPLAAPSAIAWAHRPRNVFRGTPIECPLPAIAAQCRATPGPLPMGFASDRLAAVGPSTPYTKAIVNMKSEMLINVSQPEECRIAI